MDKATTARPGKTMVTMRFPLELRDVILANARRERRTLTQEILLRLERSLEQEQEGERLARAS